MSIANRDEAKRCRDIGMNALKSGDRDKCIRFLEKSLRMYDDPHTHSLLEKVRTDGKDSSDAETSTKSSDASKTTTASPPGVRHRKGAEPTRSGDKARTNKDGKSYTDDQNRLVQRVLRTQDYYQILQIDKNDGSNDVDAKVKKAYRKLALKLHPDKNSAPGAEEAFKKVSKAFQCLSDEGKRRTYDRTGRDPEQSASSSGSSGRPDDFMTAQDIFDAFFGVPRQNSPFYAQHAQHHQQQYHQNNTNSFNILQFLPLIMLLVVTLLANFNTNSSYSHQRPKFSFTPTKSYTVQESTPDMHIQYYVPPSHAAKYPAGSTERQRFDTTVETSYVNNLLADCDFEERSMVRNIQLAKRHRSVEQLEQAKNTPRPSCDKLNRLKEKYPRQYRQSVQYWY
ncbi:molecular chaperone DnaJ, putative [Perkinsus marinus ATCC 50983]|uniref:Molecular chaperone DnaJ, putative n=1 Tax=Perkinsus marinus (strain ATCC 50983 / TXsc) TaxID=423536 RepID=C5LRY5_PERM5|nr:molecular chaperone DnaJ, putative [Perkinsus marinus ATCC 50983]EER00457.1 molecular chaperone DnaJ, putative [Perkinsus marinus ATCC 50983]|eukprot:XP_002767739.1 molecular chaperone DnaJ, putative [Perkinsus marinus ATCC 50983]